LHVFESNLVIPGFKILYLYLSKNLFEVLTSKFIIMKINKKDLPVIMETPDLILRNKSGFGDLAIAFNELPKGTDFRPLLNGLDNNSCHCDHWGYILEGAIRIFYDDKSEELCRAGDVYYWPAGHTGIVEEDVKFIEFSPQHEFKEVMDHIGKKMAELQG